MGSVAALGLVGWVATAAAPTSDSETWLQWDAPPGCPAGSDVADAIHDRLGRAPEPDEIEVRARVADAGIDGHRLTLESRRRGETVTDRRELTAHDCRALADAAALLLALSIDPLAVTARAHRPPAPPPTAPIPTEVPDPQTPPSPRSSPPPEPSPPPPAPTRRVPDVGLAVGGGIALGSTPGISGGPDVTIALIWRRARFELGGYYLAPRTADAPEGSVRVQMGAAVARGCVRLGPNKVEIPLCAGLEVGGMQGNGRDAPGSAVARGLWLAPVAAAGVRGWVIPTLAIWARFDLAVPIARPGFELREPGQPITLYQPEPVAGRVFVGIEGKIRSFRSGGRDRSRR